MILEAIIISVIIGFIRGGNLRGLRRVNKLTALLFILGALIQYLLVSLDQLADNNSIALIIRYSKPIQILSYILILIGLFTNIKFKSLWVAFTGYILNFLFLLSNNWTIPNLIGEEAVAGRFPILGKIIQFHTPYPLPKAISVGDLIIAFGIFSFIQEIMLEGDGSKYTFKF